jgi:hypothetical protein
MADIVIDRIFEEARTRTAVLSLPVAQPWDEPGAMADLHRKIDGYVSTVTTGLLLERFPKYRGWTFRISVVSPHQPSENIQVELDQLNQNLLNKGIEFEIMVIKVGTPHEQRAKLKNSILSFLKRLVGKGSRNQT